MSARATRLASVVAVVVGAWLVSGSAEAATITFNDLTDGVTFTSDTTRATAFNCPTTTESCAVDIAFPEGAFGITLTALATTIAEPGSVFISDTMAGVFVSSSVRISFVSDVEGNLGLCPPAGCSLIENGTPQPAYTIAYFAATGAPVGSDTVNFQSDVPVPEPASLLLLGTGLVAGARRWRKRQPNA